MILHKCKISHLIEILLYVERIYNLNPLFFCSLCTELRRFCCNFSHCSLNHCIMGCRFIVSTNLCSSVKCQAVCSLDCGYFDVVGLHIASFQIANIRIPQTRKAAEQENITHTFQVLLILGYLVVFQLVQFIPSQEDYFFRGGFQFRFECIVCNVLMMSFLEAPAKNSRKKPLSAFGRCSMSL